MQKKFIQLIFTENNKKLCLSLHCNGANSYLFVLMVQKFINSNQKIPRWWQLYYVISKDWSVDNMKKKGFNGYVYDFSVDCDAIAVDDILDIHKYLMKKNNMI